MFKNYIKIAWRNIIKSRFYSSVNIVGLAAGIAFTFIIGTYVWSELQVNRQLKNAGSQYIIQSKWKDPNLGIDLTSMGPLAKELKEIYPDLVANYYRWDGITSNVSKGDNSFREGIQICDSTMLSMYGFKLLYGNPATAFDGPYSVVISAEKAKMYFGKEEVVGQALSIEDFSGSKHDFVVTGVLKNPGKNSATFLNDNNNNQFYISSKNIAYFGRNMAWQNQYIVSYIELQKGVSAKDLEKPMQHLINQNAPPQVAANMTPYLVPLQEYYLSANNGLVKKMLYTLSGIALFILLMAVINFINLSVSRSASRMKEIGIRKVLGSLKRQLILQFLTESIILVFFATLLALLIAQIAKPLFENVLGKEIPSIFDLPLYFILFPLALTLVVGFIAGIYPAFVLSSLKSINSLKGKLDTAGDKVVFRKSLVAVQFGTAAIVFISAIIITSQVNLFFNSDLGFNKDFVVSVQTPRMWTKEGVRKMEMIRKQFASMPEVSNVSLSFTVPDGNSGGSIVFHRSGLDATVASQALVADEYYASTFQIPMAAGEFYCKPGMFTDSSKIVINTAQAKALGWKDPQDAIGQQLYVQGFNGPPAIVAGVTKDFHFGSMQNAIQPITFIPVAVANNFRLLSFKLKARNIGSSMQALQKKWSALLPGTPFEYTFMDESIAKLYTTELQLKKASYTATGLSMIIVLLGVLGLIALSLQKRTKEIGIRKVLGASVSGIISLFMKEFLSVILAAGLVACPLAYIIMHKWLQAYTYRVNITAMPFIISVTLLALVTGILISLQTIKAANTNPVKSLRTE